MSWFLGIEIGGTKLQLAIGDGLGSPFRGLVRQTVKLPGQAVEIRAQILNGLAQLLSETGLTRADLAGAGVGFGGPVVTSTGTIVTSHQVAGWNQFRFTEWLTGETGLPTVLHNDADSAAFAEAKFGAGRGFDPVVYVTVGSGIGGGLVLGGRVYRGMGDGALEIGHLRPLGTPAHVPLPATTVESIASGFGITDRVRRLVQDPRLGQELKAPPASRIVELCGGDPLRINTQLIARAAEEGDLLCDGALLDATDTLGWALAQTIALINPARIVIGGGVSLLGDEVFLEPVRRSCRRHGFLPFIDLAEIVPAGLHEEVVVHGALALARAEFQPPGE